MEDRTDISVRELLQIIQKRTLSDSTYFALKTPKNPADFWIYREIIFEIKPEIIIDIGISGTGSALALAHMLDSMNYGKVILVVQDEVPEIVRTYSRIITVIGDPKEKIFDVRQQIENDSKVLVLEEGAYSYGDTLKLLQIYGPLVTPGSYFILEGELYRYGLGEGEIPGPHEAISTFIRENKHFIVDRSREGYLITSSPGGFLKRLDGPLVDHQVVPAKPSRSSGKEVEIIGCSVEDEKGQVLKEIREQDRFIVKLTLKFNKKVEKPLFALAFQDENFEMIQQINTKTTRIKTYSYDPGDETTIVFHVENFFDKGKVNISAAVLSYDETRLYDMKEGLLNLEFSKSSYKEEKHIHIQRLKHMEEDLAMPLIELNPIIMFRILEDSVYYGIKTLKNPFDFWIYLELIYEVKPDIIIEIGNAYGGSTLALAHFLDRMNRGRVIGLDLVHEFVPDLVKEHPRITLITGDASQNIDRVKELIRDDDRVIVIEDSSHTYENTLNLLNIYSPLVSLGSYFIIEDSIFSHGLEGGPSPGPYEAIETFIKENRNFSIDRTREAFFITQNPKGYLKRIRK